MVVDSNDIPLFAGDDPRVLRAAAGAGHHHPARLRVPRHRGDHLPSRTRGHQVSKLLLANRNIVLSAKYPIVSLLIPLS